jgi:hypothetical protein
MGGGGKQSERKGSMWFVFLLWGLKIRFSLCMGASIVIQIGSIGGQTMKISLPKGRAPLGWAFPPLHQQQSYELPSLGIPSLRC